MRAVVDRSPPFFVHESTKTRNRNDRCRTCDPILSWRPTLVAPSLLHWVSSRSLRESDLSSSGPRRSPMAYSLVLQREAFGFLALLEQASRSSSCTLFTR